MAAEPSSSQAEVRLQDTIASGIRLAVELRFHPEQGPVTCHADPSMDPYAKHCASVSQMWCVGRLQGMVINHEAEHIVFAVDMDSEVASEVRGQ